MQDESNEGDSPADTSTPLYIQTNAKRKPKGVSSAPKPHQQAGSEGRCPALQLPVIELTLCHIM